MKSFKWLLMVLGSAGLISLGACSNGQQAANSGSSPAVSDSKTTPETSQSGIALAGQVIEPATQTGEARMTLKTAATPLKIGKNTLMLTVLDAKTGKPLAVKDVAVEMTMSEQEMKAMGMGGMGAGSAKTQVKPATSPGTFEIETSPPFGGKWQMKVNLKDTQPPASAIFALAVK